MDALRGAAPLARLLLAVGEARRESEPRELWLQQQGRVACLTLRGGALIGLSGVPLAPLGDLLGELSALDASIARGLQGESAVPIGVRLIAAGATSWSAVQRALCLQRARGVASLLRMPVTRCWRVHGVREPQRGGMVEVALADLVWDAMLAMAAQLPRVQQQPHAGQALALSAAGARRAAGRSHGALGPHDEGPHRAVLCALGFARPRGLREDAYALLLRKRRELSRNAGPCALLDLPGDADARGARRALRKLAQKLHPDRFHADDARLHQVSHEVMGALTRAAFAFRA